MERLMKRINGLIYIAQKRQVNDSEVGKTIGRQVERNLKMAKKIIGEEIVTCQYCAYAKESSEIKNYGYKCELSNQYERANDYCSRGERCKTVKDAKQGILDATQIAIDIKNIQEK